ncbi:MAG TPA: aminotransferase class V-fold PLP-dependent enzyme [Gammaproteobacteria bacterium]
MKPESYFNLDDDVIYVNHAAVAPWPIATVEAVNAFANENGRMGSRHYARWLGIEAELRERLAQLINAPSADEIALLKNTSEGLSIIAYGIDWQAGENIVIAEGEFPSNRIVWESLQSQGVELRLANLNAAETPEQALLDLCDNNTRLLSISAVQYASGLRMDLKRLGVECKKRGILYCVDAIQQIGALSFDTQAIQADFVVADGHKWMLGPEGLALFYCHREIIPQLQLNQYGWHMVEAMGDFSKTDWRPAHTARRFECGSPNMLTIHALHASVGVLLELGMNLVEQQLIDRVQYLIKAFSAMDDVVIISPIDPSRHAGIFTFRKNNINNEAMYQWLVTQGVVCAPRGGGIRFSPHFYTPYEQLDQLAEWIAAY